MQHEKLFLVAIAFPVAIVAGIMLWDALDWALAPVGLQPPDLEPVQHVNSVAVTERALDAYANLPETQREAVASDLKRAILRPAEWLADVDARRLDMICIGEDHTEETRHILATRVFPALTGKRLLIEATPEELRAIDRGLRSGDPHVPLLKADISAVMRAAMNRNDELIVTGIEETSDQREQRGDDQQQQREDSIESNFIAASGAEPETVVLLGANHCRDEAGWLFGRTTRNGAPARERSLSFRIVPDHYDDPTEAFVNFLIAVGVISGADAAARAFVIEGSHSLPAPIRKWFDVFIQNRLDVFDAVLVYRNAELARDLADRSIVN